MRKKTLKINKVKKNGKVPLAIVSVGEKVYMLERDEKIKDKLSFSVSSNGIHFVPTDFEVSLLVSPRKKEKLDTCTNFSISCTPSSFILTYIRLGKTREKNILVTAKSLDLKKWRVMSEQPAEDSTRAVVVYDKSLDRFVLYRDGLFIKNQTTRTLASWKNGSNLIFTSRYGMFDQGIISLLGAISTEEGLLVLYDASQVQGKDTLLQLGGIILDPKNPGYILWRCNMPIWQAVAEAKSKVAPITPFGFVSIRKHFVVYWLSKNLELIVVKIPIFSREVEDSRKYPKILERFHQNPIIEPLHHSHWENEGTFNPAVIEDDEGVVHLLYRALGRDGISRIGYAQSKDGMNFGSRSPFPVFETSMHFKYPKTKKKPIVPWGYHPGIYTSGGGSGGAEDPRAVLIDGTVYMLYTAFEAWDSMRIALTSISLDDFKAGKWIWKKPHLISSPKNRSKNWLIFPERVNGRFAVLHSIAPKVAIEYIDDLDTFEDTIYSPRLEGPQNGRKNSWDNYLKGSGPPPVKTDQGWLLLYHALEKTDTSKYRLGAMLLDLNDPTKVLARSKHPLLSPDMYYENDSKPGIVYASGALIRGKDLYVYYGGGDKFVCVATTPIDDLLKYLTTGDTKIYQLKKAQKK